MHMSESALQSTVISAKFRYLDCMGAYRRSTQASRACSYDLRLKTPPGKAFHIMPFVHKMLSDNILLSVIESALRTHPKLLNIQVS